MDERKRESGIAISIAIDRATPSSYRNTRMYGAELNILGEYPPNFRNRTKRYFIKYIVPHFLGKSFSDIISNKIPIIGYIHFIMNQF